MMKKLLFALIFIIPLTSFCQNDTVYYFGINGKIDNPEKKDIMKKVDYRSLRKIKVKTYKAGEEWQLIYAENIKVVNDSVYEIRMKGYEFSGRVTRIFEPSVNGMYRFTDRVGNNIKRQGTTKSKIPLILEGEVAENYNSGTKKSVAQYKNNQLITNKNWQSDGIPMVDDIFYSVDTEPGYEPGMTFLHQQIRQAIKDSKFDLLTVEGKMVVGLVITKDGKIGGVQIVKGISQVLNGILVNAFGKLEGTWIPAKLNNRNVSYFQMIPINFIYNKYNFDYLEMDRGMMYWVIN